MNVDNNKQQDIKASLKQMMKTTQTFDNFQKMMKTTRSFDEELEHHNKEANKSISNTLNRLLRFSYVLEKRNESTIRTRLRVQRLRKTEDTTLVGKLISKLPSKYRNLPMAFRRNPRVVLKYFLGMILGRVLAIVLYLIAALIPAIPVPENVQGLVGRPIKALGSVVAATRGAITDPSMIIGLVTSIPTDVNKLLQKVGEFFQFYGRRVWAFVVKIIRHPKLAYEDVTNWSRNNARMLSRLCRSAVAVTCSFVMIKLAMVFLLPLFGGIAITVAGLKISIVLMVVIRMIVDKVGEIIGTKVFGKIAARYRRKQQDGHSN